MKVTFTLISLFFSVSIFAQKLPDFGFNKVRIAEPDRTIQAELKPATSNPVLKPDRLYFWYSGNAVHTSQGGFSGKLLNGSYNEYFLNKNLKKQGLFTNGLMNGVWKEWNENGSLLNSYTLRKGIKHGKYALYNADGILTETGTYSSNKLNGAIAYYTGRDSLKTVYYQNGVIIKKRTFWQRINIFRK